ncbi:phosphate acyltransferase PlsX [bacterium]|nr:MAG: phosphate acyltransferase PlsX [bacterium]
MRIALDAMGGDNAPDAVVDGAVQAVRKSGHHVILVGDRDLIYKRLDRYWRVKRLPISVHHASQVVTMDESPASALRRKRDSSMRVALDLVRAGEANAAVSAGNSGAFMAKAMHSLRLLEGVERPAIATLMPSRKGFSIVLDVGGNVGCTPRNLVQFAVMGDVFAHDVLGVKKPKVGLLANGEETSKGTELTRNAHELLRDMRLNYIGYVEGRDAFNGDCDVIVTDGFTGNVLLKTAEGVAKLIYNMLKEEYERSRMGKLGYLLSTGVWASLRKRIDYREVGGAPLLGVNGVAMICHGASDSRAIKSAVIAAARYAERRLELHMMEKLASCVDQEKWASTKERGFWEKSV